MGTRMENVSIFCPGKINLTLAVTGRRSDGYHDLISLVVPIRLGDELKVRRLSQEGIFLKTSGEPAPSGGENLVVKAANRFIERFPGEDGGLVFELHKNIPSGAGLGGGSSDAAGALLALNELSGCPADTESMNELALGLGSDCPLFLHRRPVIVRGRGERIEALPAERERELRGRRLLVFKPFFGVSTGWAYRELARRGAYSKPAAVEEGLDAWKKGTVSAEGIMRNDFEDVVGSKYLAIRVLLRELRERFGIPVHMSGSGSACFALLREEGSGGEVAESVREAFGAEGFCTETGIVW